MYTYYNINTDEGYCMVLGNVCGASEVICSHIWPGHMNGNFLDSFGLTLNDSNNPRNFFRLNESIEKAFDEKRLIFLKTPNEDENIIQLKIVLLLLIMPITFPFNVFPTNGLFVDFDLISDCSKVYSIVGSKTVKQAFSPSAILGMGSPKIILGFMVN